MKARISKSLSARCTSACPLRHTCTREEKHRERRTKNKHATFVKKGERFSSEEEENRKKVHNFSHTSRPSHFSPHFLSTKPLSFERKLLSLRLTKHNSPFFSPRCGVYYSAKGRAFPDETTHTIFDLPKTMTPFSDLSVSNRHTDSQSVQPWSFPFISATLCAKCSKRNSYFCPKLNIRISSLSRGLAQWFSTAGERARRANQDTLRQYEHPRTQRTRDCTPQLSF